MRSEALVGLASRDRKLALPLVIDALKGEAASVALFQAAELVADARLVEHLVPWMDPSGSEWIDRQALDALAACEAAGRAGER